LLHNVFAKSPVPLHLRGTILASATFEAALSGQHWEGNSHMGVSVLIGILITFLVVILVLYLVQRLPLDARARQIAQIIVIIIGIISLLKYLAVF
jgi:hypothetical protein